MDHGHTVSTSLGDYLGDVVEWAELEDKVAPVVGRQVDLHLDALAHHVPATDLAKQLPGWEGDREGPAKVSLYRLS